MPAIWKLKCKRDVVEIIASAAGNMESETCGTTSPCYPDSALFRSSVNLPGNEV